MLLNDFKNHQVNQWKHPECNLWINSFDQETPNGNIRFYFWAENRGKFSFIGRKVFFKYTASFFPNKEEWSYIPAELHNYINTISKPLGWELTVNGWNHYNK